MYRNDTDKNVKHVLHLSSCFTSLDKAIFILPCQKKKYMYIPFEEGNYILWTCRFYSIFIHYMYMRLCEYRTKWTILRLLDVLKHGFK